MLFRLIFLLLSVGLTLSCGGNSSSSAVVPSQTPAAEAQKPAPRTTLFDGERAFKHVRTQVEFGPRPAGSPALEKTRQYLLSELNGAGLKTRVEAFTAPTPRGKVKFQNLIAELPGETSDVILLASHYDTKPYKEFAFVGANDGGSSTGALLEIARVMAAEKRKSRFTYWFVFFDGEEAFCRDWSECLKGKDNTYGSRQMVAQLKQQKQLDRIKAMILLDMIGDRDLTLAQCEESSPWLVETIWETAREAGHAAQFQDRTQSMVDDHIAFLEAGIPAVDLIDFEYGDEPEANNFWHTRDDTLDKISPQSLKIVGDVVLLSLPRIEAQIR
ncbi:MAG: M28 family peptidase [Blastocatellia bacterium]|nr:M28 family peptidase [Blastocatellia bacterium]